MTGMVRVSAVPVGFGRAVLGAGVLALGLAGAPMAQDFTTLKGHGGPIMGLAVAEDGRVGSASFDNSVGLWRGA